MVIGPSVSPWVVYPILSALLIVIIIKMCITIRRLTPYKKTIDGMVIGDIIAMTDKTFMVISHILDRKTVTFHVYKFAEFKGKKMGEIKDMIKSEIQNVDYLYDYIALYDAQTGSWKPKTKGRV